MLRMHMHAAATVACIYDPYFLDDPLAPYELLVPVFGASVASQVLREAGVQAARHITRQLVRRFIRRNMLKLVKRVALKYFGKKVTQKLIVTKTVPVVGAVVGGGWNYGEMKVTGKRVIDYFEGRSIS